MDKYEDNPKSNVLQTGSSTIESILKIYPPANQLINIKLINEIRNGSEKAREEIVLRNSKLIYSRAKRRYGKSLSLEDLFNEGALGLLKAIETYDQEKGAFSTYAVIWIDQAISNALGNTDKLIRLPVNLEQLIKKVNAYLSKCEQEGRPVPDDGELKDIFDISDDILDKIKSYRLFDPVSINITVGDDKKTELEYFLKSDRDDFQEILDEMVERELLVYLKTTLDKRSYYILYHRIITDDPKTSKDISEELGVTGERVRQIEKMTLKKIEFLIASGKKDIGVARVRREIDIKRFRIDPISVDDYVTYLILKDIFSEEEALVYKEFYFREYNYNVDVHASRLGMSTARFCEVKKLIDKKIGDYIKGENRAMFLYARKNILQKYGSQLFEMDLDDENLTNELNYLKLYSLISTSSLEKIKEYFKSNEIEMPRNIEKLFEYFYYLPECANIYLPYIEQDVNITKYGYKRTTLSFDKIYETYKQHESEFTLQQKQYMQIYRESFSNKRGTSRFESGVYTQVMWFIEQLERMYFGYKSYLNLNFTKEDYERIRDVCVLEMEQDRVKLLDEVYLEGISLDDVARKRNISSDKARNLFAKAKKRALSLEIGKNREKKIDINIYVDILKDPEFEISDKSRKIATMYFTDGKTYKEIAKEMKITERQVSNKITDLLWEMDFYRFGLVKKRKYKAEIIDEVLVDYKDSEKKIIIDVIHGKSRDSFENMGYNREKVLKIMKRFYNDAFNKTIERVQITREDIIEEVLVHPTNRILSEDQRKYYSLKYGIKTEYNEEGLIYSFEVRMRKMGLKQYQINKLTKAAENTIKGKKAGLVRATYDYIDRENLECILNDDKVPIDNRSKQILCSYYDVCGSKRMTIKELAEYYKKTEGNIVRVLMRSIVIIKRYMNGEIEGKVSFSKDVKPFLKYFSLADREIIIMQFRDDVSLMEIARIKGMTFNQILSINLRIELFLKQLREGKIKGIDFDLYYKLIEKKELPFYGDLELARKIFHLHFEERRTIPEIIDELNLPFGFTSTTRLLNNLILAIYKLDSGIRKVKEISYEEIRKYFLDNNESMSIQEKLFYLRYFRSFKNRKVPFYAVPPVSPKIALDLIKAQHQDCFDLQKSSKEDVIKILKQYGHSLDQYTVNALRVIYNIRGKDLMSGSDKMMLLRAVSNISDIRKDKVYSK